MADLASLPNVLMVQFSAAESYWLYLRSVGIIPNATGRSQLSLSLDRTNWEHPQSALDANNIAVMALIEADRCDELESRSLLLETALEALTAESDHPLAQAHLALLHDLTGNSTLAMQLAFSSLIATLQPAHTAATAQPTGLVYLPTQAEPSGETEILTQILQADDGNQQALLLLAEVLRRSQLVFYNATGLRLLTLALQFFPTSVPILLHQGISSIVCQQWEGLRSLHQAQQLAPQEPRVLQALYLAYRDLAQPETADFWLTTARKRRQQVKRPNPLSWQWTEAIAHAFTYLPFDELHLTVEASFRSIVTSVLLAAGDWFERELEFWRHQIKPGMTVIDVGANVGVYTFSAARRVGPTGRVLAVEPFSGCVQCLQESCRINHLPWVTICAGAASDRNGIAQLALKSASELNEVIVGENDGSDNFEQVTCFTLDSLVAAENLDRVDFLKIDAEGHEMQVLKGSDRILAEFKPVILYENIAGSQGSNLPVAEYLQSKGYCLFRYQPYVRQLIAIATLDDIQGSLNVLAIPTDR